MPWGPKKGSYGTQIGLFWSSIEISSDGSQGRIKGGKLRKKSAANIVDTTNNTVGEGGGITDFEDANLNFSGSGEKDLRSVAGQWVNLSYTSKAKGHYKITSSGVDAAPGLIVEGDIEFPLRAIGKPDAPVMGAVTGSPGTSRTVNWTNTNPADSSKPYQNTVVSRNLNDGGFFNVATLGVVTSWVNANLPPNSKILYRVAGRNSSADSDWSATSAATYTKPSAPIMGTATKNAAGNIVVTVTNNAPYASRLILQDSPDGVAWVNVDTNVAPGAGQKEHVGPNTAVTHRYRWAAVTPDGQQSDWSTVSNIVALQAPPNPPTILGPSSAQDPSEAITLAYRHNPVDTTPQTQREIQYRLNGGDWTSLGVETTAVQSKVIAGGTWGPALLEWQARTRGAHATFSGWSATSAVVLTSRPIASIIKPTVAEHTATIQGETGYYDPQGLAQSLARLSVSIPDGDLLQTVEAPTGAALPPFTISFQSESTYRFLATVVNSAGLASLPEVRDTLVTFLPPGEPSADWVWDTDRGAVSFDTENPAGVEGVTVDTDSQELWRIDPGSGEESLVVSGVAPNTTLTDPTPFTSGGEYRLRALSAEGSAVDTIIQVDPDRLVAMFWWLNGGDFVTALKYNPKRQRSTSLAQVSEHYAGRRSEVVTYGEAVTRSVSLSGILVLDEGTSWDEVERIAILPEPAILRGPDGTRYQGRIENTSASDNTDVLQEVEVAFFRVSEEEEPDEFDLE